MSEHEAESARIKVVCPTCTGSGWSAVGWNPGGGYCDSCRGFGEVTAQRRATLLGRESRPG